MLLALAVLLGCGCAAALPLPTRVTATSAEEITDSQFEAFTDEGVPFIWEAKSVFSQEKSATPARNTNDLNASPRQRQHAFAAVTLGTASRYTSPLTRLGPVLVVCITDDNAAPAVPKETISEVLFATPHSLSEMYSESSWGAMSLAVDDVDVMELTVTGDVTGDGIVTLRSMVMAEASFTTQYAAREYMHWVMVAPGSTFGAVAFVGTRSSPSTVSDLSTTLVRGSAISGFSTWSHEIGHNLGLSHAGGFRSASGFYEEYQDDATMGFERFRAGDFNVVSRFHLGWINAAHFRRFPATSFGRLRALNEGPASDGSSLLMMTAPCAFCASINPETATITGGDLYFSFRVVDAGNPFGVSSGTGVGVFAVDTLTLLQFEDVVHVHFQPTNARHTELWKTLDASEQWTVPGSGGDGGLYMMICTTQTKTDDPSVSTEFAELSLSSVSLDDASKGCTDQPPSPPPAISPPPSPPSSPSPLPNPPPPPGLCTNTCRFANDSECDDGGPGHEFSECLHGTDCADCGVRLFLPPPPLPPSLPLPSIATSLPPPSSPPLAPPPSLTRPSPPPPSGSPISPLPSPPPSTPAPSKPPPFAPKPPPPRILQPPTSPPLPPPSRPLEEQNTVHLMAIVLSVGGVLVVAVGVAGLVWYCLVSKGSDPPKEATPTVNVGRSLVATHI